MEKLIQSLMFFLVLPQSSLSQSVIPSGAFHNFKRLSDVFIVLMQEKWEQILFFSTDAHKSQREVNKEGRLIVSASAAPVGTRQSVVGQGEKYQTHMHLWSR